MALVNGRPFLEYQLDYWIAQGILRFVLSAGYKYEMIQHDFGDRYKSAEIAYAVEEKQHGGFSVLFLKVVLLILGFPMIIMRRLRCFLRDEEYAERDDETHG